MIATTAAVVAAGATGIGVGAGAGSPFGVGPAKTIPGETTSTTSTSSTSSTTTTTSEPVDTGSPLPARASLPQLAAALRPILGPTDDFTDAVGRIIDLPDGVPTPNEAQIAGIEVHLWATGDFEVVVDLRTSAVADDIAQFYEANMRLNGYEVASRATNQDAEGRRQELTFTSSEADRDDVSVTVAVTDIDDHITITVSDRSTGSPLEAFIGWTAGLSMLDAGIPDELTLTLSSTVGLRVAFTTAYLYESDTAEDVASDIRAALPAGGFSLDEDAPPGTDPDPQTIDEIPLVNALLDDTWIVVRDSPDRGVVVVVAGNLRLSR